MILGGVAQFFPVSVQHVIVGIYVILFGVATGLLGEPASYIQCVLQRVDDRCALLLTPITEFQIPPQVAKYASFMFSFIGRGICRFTHASKGNALGSAQH